MRVGIFYFSLKAGKDRQRVVVDGYTGFIRVEVVETVGLVEALDLAKPQAGETVMNTHEVPS